MEYRIRVEETDNGDAEIVLGYDPNNDNRNQDTVISVEFKIDTVDNNTKDRSSNVINHLTIKGNLKKESTEACLQLLNWSKSNDYDSVYRTVNVELRVNNKPLRVYKITNMFCVDYTETFASDKDQGTFELILNQRKESLEDIEASCQ